MSVRNMPLLVVKAFLADVRGWQRDYIPGSYMCAEFATYVCQEAANRGIRCGFVIVSFDGVDVGHAMVAFDTDYGLQYFEPQTGEEERIVVGFPYRAAASGIPPETPVSSVSIIWNDDVAKTVTHQ